MSGGPWFVVKKDVEQNVIYVSNGYDPETQYGKTVNLAGFSYITKDVFGNFEGTKDITFKVRHTPEFTTGTIEKIGDIYRIQSDDKIQGIAAGQFGVVYDRESKLCLGSGIIADESDI